MKYIQILNFSVVGVLALSWASMAIAAPKLSSRSKAQVNGVGAVRVGMTVKEASQAAGISLVSSYESDSIECRYVNPRGMKNIGMMVSRDRIVRIDMYGGSSIRTFKGAGIGDSEARIKSLYPGKIEVSQHHYNPKGHYLTFVPKDAADRAYRIVFETDGRKVLNYRVGKLPDVEFVEGCS